MPLVACVAILSTAGVAWAANGSCPNGLPFCFAANSPARAAEVNENFAQLKEWLEQKVGAVGSGDVSSGTVSATTANVSGAVSAGSANITSLLTANSITANSITASTSTVSADLHTPANVWGSGPTAIGSGVTGAPGELRGLCPNGQFMCGLAVVNGNTWTIRCCQL